MTTQKLYIVIVLFFYLAACQKKEYAYSLTDTQIIQILMDLHASEAMTKNFDVTLRDSVSKVYYQQVLEIHEVSEKVFTKDFEELKRNPTKLELVYRQVEQQLEKKRNKTYEK